MAYWLAEGNWRQLSGSCGVDERKLKGGWSQLGFLSVKAQFELRCMKQWELGKLLGTVELAANIFVRSKLNNELIH